jgi:hypothetical protein
MWIPDASAGDETRVSGSDAHSSAKIPRRRHWFTYEIVQIHKMTTAGKWFTAEVNLLHSLISFHYIQVIQTLIYHCLIIGSLGIQCS